MRLTVTFLMLLVAGLPLAAQTIRASLYGRVLDPQSSPVPNAKVRATHLATGTAYVFVTNENGGYDFPRLLQFGDYSVEAEAAGDGGRAVVARVVHDDDVVGHVPVELCRGLLERLLGVVGRHDDTDAFPADHRLPPLATPSAARPEGED